MLDSGKPLLRWCSVMSLHTSQCIGTQIPSIILNNISPTFQLRSVPPTPIKDSFYNCPIWCRSLWINSRLDEKRKRNAQFEFGAFDRQAVWCRQNSVFLGAILISLLIVNPPFWFCRKGFIKHFWLTYASIFSPKLYGTQRNYNIALRNAVEKIPRSN